MLLHRESSIIIQKTILHSFFVPFFPLFLYSEKTLNDEENA